MINKLYEASQAGVKIKLIIRGIIGIKPGIPGLSENIDAISIVDKYLEHSRILYFHHGGEELMYLSSADWMVRNLDNRIEVTAPVYDESIKKELKHMLKIQLQDNVKARLLSADLSNKHITNDKKRVRAQEAFYQYLKLKYSKEKTHQNATSVP